MIIAKLTNKSKLTGCCAASHSKTHTTRECETLDTLAQFQTGVLFVLFLIHEMLIWNRCYEKSWQRGEFVPKLASVFRPSIWKKGASFSSECDYRRSSLHHWGGVGVVWNWAFFTLQPPYVAEVTEQATLAVGPVNTVLHKLKFYFTCCYVPPLFCSLSSAQVHMICAWLRPCSGAHLITA